jgi:general secretion pathway protein F
VTVWHYTAVHPQHRLCRSGEIAAASAADARASLRRVGLHAIDMRPMRTPLRTPRTARPRTGPIQSIRAGFERRRRRRRRPRRAELFDALATLLESGVPLLESVQTRVASAPRRKGEHRMLLHLRARLQDGATLESALGDHPGWFDPVEIALARAGRVGGHLPRVLRSLADRHEHANDLRQTILGALAYPLVVAAAGVAVLVFLSLYTLPQLASILEEASVEPPALTMGLIAVGRGLADHWLPIAAGIVALPALAPALPAALARLGFEPHAPVALVPSTIRRLLVASATIRLGELVSADVPLVEALRVVAPTARHHVLRRRLGDAAARIERGEDVAAALDDTRWFDASYRCLLVVGQQSGELETVLDRLGRREHRRAQRRVDHAAALLEPAVILVLAAFVGVVVMAIVLPLLRLQAVIG